MLNFLTLILSVSPNIIYFFAHFRLCVLGVRLIAIEDSEEVQNYEKIVWPTPKTFLKMAGGRMHTLHPTSLGPPPGHKLQKPSKESGIFQLLGIISFSLLY